MTKEVSYQAIGYKEDYGSAIARTENRKDRSHLFGLMKRFVETCNDDDLIKLMLTNLANWVHQSGDDFAAQQLDKARSQLDTVICFKKGNVNEMA